MSTLPFVSIEHARMRELIQLHEIYPFRSHTDLSATCNKTLFSVFGMFVTTTESLWCIGWERRTEGEKAVREGRVVSVMTLFSRCSS